MAHPRYAVHLPVLKPRSLAPQGPPAGKGTLPVLAPKANPAPAPQPDAGPRPAAPREDVLCIMPWAHLFFHQSGKVLPCCTADYDHPVGDVRQSSIADIWNSKEMRELRLRMLRGQKSPACASCYEREQAGSWSPRRSRNACLSHHFWRLGATGRDGRLNFLNMPYWDIRFSNLCNFKCRTCNHGSSSRWYGDATRLSHERDKAPLIRLHDDPEHIWSQVRPLLGDAEEIYFAGGEPLLMSEHYRILDLLLRQGRTDVVLRYNTNFSRLEYRGRSVLDLWNRFRNVYVDASLDASGTRGELLRHGTDWRQTLHNRERLRKECPHVIFRVSATVSVMNVHHLPDFHRELVGLRVVETERFNAHNILIHPPLFRVQILPAAMKRKVEESFARHLYWLTHSQGIRPDSLVCQNFRAVVDFMNASDQSSLIPEFLDNTYKLDGLRRERFFTVFPELASLQHR